MSVFASKILRGFSVVTIGSLISKLLLVVSTFYLTNVLSKESFGEFSFIRNSLNLIFCICALNFTSLCTKYAVDSRHSSSGTAKLILLILFSLGVSVLTALVILLIPTNLILQWFDSPLLAFYARVLALILPVLIFQPLAEGIFRGLEKFALTSYLQIGSSTVYVASLVLFVTSDQSYVSVGCLIVYYVLYSIVSVSILLYTLCKEQRLHYVDIKSIFCYVSVLKSSVLPVFVLSFIEAPIFWLMQLLLAKSSSISAIGSMTAIMQLRNFIVLIPTYFFNTYLTFVAQKVARGELSGYYNSIRKISKYTLVAGAALAIVCSLISEELLTLYGQDYASDKLPLIISNIAIPFLLLSLLYRIDYIVQDRQNSLLRISIVWNVLWVISYLSISVLFEDGVINFFLSQLIAIVLQFILMLFGYLKSKKNNLL